MSYRDMNLSLGGVHRQGLQKLNDVDLSGSKEVSGDDDSWEEVDLSDPPRVWQQSSKELKQVDLSRVGSSQSLDDAQKALQKLPGKPWTETVTEGLVVRHPVTSHTIRIPREMLPPIIPSSVTREELTQIIQEKINRGCELVRKLLSISEPLPEKAELRDVTDLMWYLHTAAEYKSGSHWKEGAISFEDPQGRIREFLDRCKGHAYQRLSTHVEGFQSAPDGRPRGIDCYGHESPDGLLPYGRQTLLYQKMGTEGSAKTPGMPRNMLFLKMEQYGAYEARQQIPGQGPTRLPNQHDRGAWWGHVGTTICSIARRIFGLNTPEGSRKERVSSEMQKDYDKLASWSLFRRNLPGEVRRILQQNNPGNTASGVRVMKRNIDQAIAWLRQNGGTDQQIARLQQFHDKYFTNPQWDHLDLRIGNEVILTRNDLFEPRRLVHAQGTTALNLVQKVDKDELLDRAETELQRLVNAPQSSDTHRDLEPTSNGVCRQFETDLVNRRGGQVIIGGKEIPLDEKEQPAGKARLEALKEFFTNEYGELDEEGLLTASRLMNQATASILVDVLQLNKNGEPPIPGFALPSKQELRFEILRDKTGQVHVRIGVDIETGMIQKLDGSIDLSQKDARLRQEIGFVMPGRGAKLSQVRVSDIDYMMTTND